jgi:hypothetical protein
LIRLVCLNVRLGTLTVKPDEFLETVDIEFLIDSGGSLLYVQLRDCVLINGEWYMRGLLRVNPQRHHRN